jgi:hypothetical protein
VSQNKEKGIMAEKSNGKTSKAEWTMFVGQLNEVILVFGSILFMPVILIVGIGYGLRAGILAGVQKSLDLFKEWGN